MISKNLTPVKLQAHRFLAAFATELAFVLVVELDQDSPQAALVAVQCFCLNLQPYLQLVTLTMA